MRKTAAVLIVLTMIALVPTTVSAGGYEYDYARGSGTVIQPTGAIDFSFTARSRSEEELMGADADGNISISTETGSIMADIDCMTVENYLTGDAPFGTAVAIITRRSGSTPEFPTDEIQIRFQDNDDSISGAPDTISIEAAPFTQSSCFPAPGDFPLVNGDIVAYDRDL